MADIGTALRIKLLSVDSVNLLIGLRMYPDVLGQDAPNDSVVYTIVSTQREHSISSAGSGDSLQRLAHARLEFRCYSDTRATANEIAKAIQFSGICSFRGTVDGITFCGAEVESGDTYTDNPPTNGNSVHRYITDFDLIVHYKECC